MSRTAAKLFLRADFLAATRGRLGGLKLLDPYEPNKWKRVLSGNLFAILAPNQGERASRVGKLFCAAVPKMYLCPLAVAFQYRAPTICGVANVLPGFQFHCATSLLTHDQNSSYTRNCQSQASTGLVSSVILRVCIIKTYPMGLQRELEAVGTKSGCSLAGLRVKGGRPLCSLRGVAFLSLILLTFGFSLGSLLFVQPDRFDHSRAGQGVLYGADLFLLD
jgi:hypothetical protein